MLIIASSVPQPGKPGMDPSERTSSRLGADLLSCRGAAGQRRYYPPPGTACRGDRAASAARQEHPATKSPASEDNSSVSVENPRRMGGMPRVINSTVWPGFSRANRRGHPVRGANRSTRPWPSLPTISSICSAATARRSGVFQNVAGSVGTRRMADHHPIRKRNRNQAGGLQVAGLRWCLLQSRIRRDP